jgi:ATP-dependent RNA helicase MRH4
MVLSADVTKAKVKPKPTKTNPNSPFGGMNQTTANIRGSTKLRSRAEIKRSSHNKEEQKPKGRSEYKALRMQQALGHIGYGKRNAIKEKISEIHSFDNFGLLPVIHESIGPQALRYEGEGSISPTPIQRLAIPALLGEKQKKRRSKDDVGSDVDSFLLAAETGSGKTLAYLLPVIDALKRAEAAEAESTAQEREIQKQERQLQEEKRQQALWELESPKRTEPHPTAARPRAIILLPTAELVDQVGAVAKLLSHTVKFRASLISSSYSGVVVRNRLFSPNGIDMLISTPHLLASITENEPNVLSRVTHLVIDEADSLLDKSFIPSTTAVLDRSMPSLKQLILCSATIPLRLDKYLRRQFPNIRRLATPNLHAIPRRVQLGVVDVERDPYRGNKDLACADTIWTIGKGTAEYADDFAGSGQKHKTETKRILVFVNEREKTTELAKYLQSTGIDAVPLSRDTSVRQQTDILAPFMTGAEPEEHDSKTPKKPTRLPARRILPNTKVLVVTDLASRGIDTTAVRHVILYDVPHTTIDFIHRLGRTGRMGRRGRGIVLVGRNDRKDVVKEVREGMFRGQALI